MLTELIKLRLFSIMWFFGLSFVTIEGASTQQPRQKMHNSSLMIHNTQIEFDLIRSHIKQNMQLNLLVVGIATASSVMSVDYIYRDTLTTRQRVLLGLYNLTANGISVTAIFSKKLSFKSVAAMYVALGGFGMVLANYWTKSNKVLGKNSTTEDNVNPLSADIEVPTKGYHLGQENLHKNNFTFYKDKFFSWLSIW